MIEHGPDLPFQSRSRGSKGLLEPAAFEQLYELLSALALPAMQLAGSHPFVCRKALW
jgi:hypothetical protein